MKFYEITLYNKRNKLLSKYHKFADDEIDALKKVINVIKFKNNDKLKITKI